MPGYRRYRYCTEASAVRLYAYFACVTDGTVLIEANPKTNRSARVRINNSGPYFQVNIYLQVKVSADQSVVRIAAHADRRERRVATFDELPAETLGGSLVVRI
jgi:hypothetical protein